MGNAILIVFIIIIMIICFKEIFVVVEAVYNEERVISNIDNEPYKVVRTFANKQRAADILSEINKMYVIIIKHLKNRRMNTHWSDNIIYLSNNYNPDVLGEHIPSDLKYTSYVRDKGRKIRLCLRKIEDRNIFHDMNTIKFVALHELSHLMTEEYGHEEEFWRAFKFILLEASSLGLINLIKYNETPQDYCGISITSNPVFS
jgi:hypothetical protein